MHYNNQDGSDKKKFVKIEIKKRYNFPQVQNVNKSQQSEKIKLLNEQKQDFGKSNTNQDAEINKKLSQNDAEMKKALFFGDKNLVNKIRSEQLVYKRTLELNRRTSPQTSMQRNFNPNFTQNRESKPFGQRFFKPSTTPYIPIPQPINPVKSPLKDKKDFSKKYIAPFSGPKLKFEQSSIRFTNNMLGSIESADDLDLDKNARIGHRKDRNSKSSLSLISKNIVIEGPMDIKSIASAMSVRAQEVLKKLKELGAQSRLDTVLDIEMTEFIIKEFGHKVKIKQGILDKVKTIKSNIAGSDQRAPIVAVVGHVDHGKTSLLDRLRKTNFTSKESGGITQSIGASQVYLNDKFVTFIDTPGHKLFTSMRAKGMNLTDIILIVVAGDDGVKEQTIESIKHAKSTGAFLIVVITKADKVTQAEIDKVKRSLIVQDIIVESMGGNVPDICVSSKTGQNITELLELIILSGEFIGLKADNSTTGYGKVLDSYLDKYKGPVADVIVLNGTIKKGDPFVSGNVSGKVKMITDWKGHQLTEAKPSFPVQISGFDDTVSANEDFVIMKDQNEAKEAALKRSKIGVKQEEKQTLYSFEDIWKRLIGQEEVDGIRFVIKSESDASAEALASAIAVSDSDQINRIVVSANFGPVTESDVQKAKACDARIIAFKVDVPSSVLKMANTINVKIKRYNVIYSILDDLEQEIKAMFAPKEIFTEVGKAEIRKVFMKPKPIAGCIVLNGIIKRNYLGVVMRGEKELWKGKIISIRQVKDDIKEAKTGQECGIFIENFKDYEVGDCIKCFEVIKNEEHIDNLS